ncbi:NifB/NifX family molybdenum-iron cluster-binding protein [Oceanirhabdus sp. W0125-5]|uniref:NifB/NifX family molybdenum-iron cluster-binding protein n=1 Tax=Oceanirhabdus sp. W0125-5 TaxID=2999116 RepID=UPI0022F2EF0C|nr:NifB/NifX family molybdenum-iron cluster-binding protein [Oceanirhabdus sp. W0125-5]WBW96926.1 NifB/NifX family molybdenum-iron cluster-binding protein [Oceanirhabdus sp. W0125-5]
MKIAISSMGNSREEIMDMRFGRCGYFIIHDTDTGESYSINNNGLDASGGAGITAAQQVINEKVESIITGNLGPNAFKIINAAGIKAYKGCKNSKVEEMVKAYIRNELDEINTPGKAHMGTA